jgi:hypothetical protein
MQRIALIRPSAADSRAYLPGHLRSQRRSVHQPLNPLLHFQGSFLVSTLKKVLSNAQFLTASVLLPPCMVILEFDLALKQVLVLAAFKFN